MLKYKPDCIFRASPVVQLVKNPPAMRETWLRSLGWEDPLEKGKGTHSSILPREFHGLYSPWGCKESDTTKQLSHTNTLNFSAEMNILKHFKHIT